MFIFFCVCSDVNKNTEHIRGQRKNAAATAVMPKIFYCVAKNFHLRDLHACFIFLIFSLFRVPLVIKTHQNNPNHPF